MFSGALSLPHLLLFGIVLLLLFGRGRFSEMMGDIAKGVKNFKKGMSDEDEDHRTVRPAEPPRRIQDGGTIEVPPADRVRPADPAAAPPPERREP